MKNNPFTRFLSVALTAVMLVGVMPGAVLADAGEAIVGASSAVVESIPESTTPADAAPVATEVPPVTEPEATPEAVQPEASPEVEATPEATEQPETTPEATQEPEATPEATEQPETTPEATQEPEAAPEATEQPETTPEATQEPEATPEATEEPEATPEATEEPEASPEPTEEPVELNEKEYIITADVTGAQGVTVTVKVPANTLPEDVNLVAEMLAENTQAHADAEAALAEAEVQYDGMIAMDIRFEDAQGNEVEPANEVEVSIDAQALLPEEADPETVAVQHLKEDENGAVTVETVADAAPATGDITVAENVEQAALNMASTFAVEGFSTFTITFQNSSASLRFTFYDTDGNELNLGSEYGSVLNALNNLQVKEGETLYFSNMAANNGIAKIQIGEDTYAYQSTMFVDNGNWHPVQSVSRYDGDELRLYDSVMDPSTGFYTKKGTVDVRFIYYKESDDSTGPVDTKTELQRSKKVNQINGQDEYDLTLSVSGAVGNVTDPQKVDVIFVVDRSSSMRDPMWDGSVSKTRTQVVGEAAGELARSMNGNENLDVRYSVVAFSEGINNQNFYNDGKIEQYWTKDAEAVERAASIAADRGKGTNYQAGLVQARSLLMDVRADAKKYVIFLSDGRPTYYYGWGSGILQDPNKYGYTKGSGQEESDNIQESANAAYEEASKLTNLNGFFSIRVGSESGADSILSTLCEKVRVASNGSNEMFRNFPASDVDDLKEVFHQIQGSITTLLCEDVTVTDTLSDYVEAKEGAVPTLLVTTKTEQGETVNVTAEEQKAGNIEVSYNSETKQLQMNFADTYKLREGYVYSVTLRIVPTQAAYQNSTNPDAIITADEETGTFAGQDGLPSNKQATVVYKYLDKDQSNSFDDPVIQVTDTRMVITKTFSGADALPDNYTVTVTSANQEEPVAVLNLDDASDSSQAKTYTWTLSNLAAGTYYVVESNTYLPDKSMEASIVVQPGSGTAITTNGVSAEVPVEAKSTTTVAITNTYSDANGNLQITKTFKNAAGEKIAAPQDVKSIRVVVEEYYTVTQGDENKEETLDEHVVILTKNQDGDFTGTVSGVKYYTEFRIKSEYLLDGEDGTGNEVLNSDEYEKTFTFDRNYLDSEITGMANQTATEDNSFYLPSNTFILVKNDHSGWSLVMRYLPAESDREAIETRVCTAAAEAKKDHSIKGDIPASAAEISWKTLEQISQEGVQINYQQDGLTKLTFDGSDKWAQFIYGNFDVLDQAIEGSLTNTIKNIDIPVEKIWDDNENSNNLRPDDVAVTLMNGSTPVKTITLTKTGDWKGSFTNLPRYDASGALIDYNKYTVTDTVEGYTASSSYKDGKFILTNSLASGNLIINKTLLSFNDTMGTDATFIFKITHQASGKVWYRHMTFNKADSDSLTMEDMPAGTYTVEELQNAGYKLTNDCADIVYTSVTAVQPGEANFSNEKIGDNTPGDQDYVLNSFKYVEGQGWVFNQG